MTSLRTHLKKNFLNCLKIGLKRAFARFWSCDLDGAYYASHYNREQPVFPEKNLIHTFGIRAKRAKRAKRIILSSNFAIMFCKFCCFFAKPLKVRAFLDRYNMGQKHQNCPFPVILKQCFSQSKKASFALKNFTFSTM